jgi:hypothetical protein
VSPSESCSVLTFTYTHRYAIGSVGKNAKVLLKRLGAVLAVAMVVVCAFDFKNALVRDFTTDSWTIF